MWALTNYIVWSCLAITCNILDTITTYIGLYKLPVELRATETNPIMNSAFKKIKFLIPNIVKHLVVIGFVVWEWFIKDYTLVQFLALVLVLVVVNNEYVLVSRVIRKKQVRSPIYNVGKVLRIPDKLMYLFIIVVIYGVVYVVEWLGFGVRLFT